MRRIIASGVIAVMLVVGITVAVQAQSSPDRKAVERQSQLTPFPRLPEIHLSIPELNVNCKTVACVNKQLTRLDERLSKQIDKLDALFDEFQQEVFECEQLVQLTQYFGYLYTADGVNVFETTALDYTEAAGQPFTYFVVYTCPVA